MSLPAAAPIDETTAAPPGGDFFSYQANLLLYLAVLLFPVLVLMLVALPWTRYGATVPGKWMTPAMEYRYTLHGVNAEVVISGDSTGLVALDPLVMQPELHMSVVNLASLGSIFNVQLDDMLDRYLLSNQPPRLIIVSLSPWNLRRDPVTATNSFEGIVMLVRHGTWRQIVRFVLAHPLVAVSFEFQVLQSLLNPLHRTNLWLQQELAGHRGFVPISPPSLEHPCKLLKPYMDPETPDGLAFHFYQKYSSPRTRVLVYMAPVADCAGSEQFRAPHRHEPWLVPSAVVPAIDVCQDGMHLESYAAASNSHAADRYIREYLRLP